MKFTVPPSNEFASLEQLCCAIQKSHLETKSWQLTGDAFGVNKAMARLLAKGYNPGKKVRKILNLPDVAEVVVIFGVVPNGTQAIKADQCACGQWFISNSPRRKKCFKCSPYRKK